MKSNIKINKCVSVTLGILVQIFKQIDTPLNQENAQVSRNHWIIESYIEKFRRTDAGDMSNGAR
ncbi:MAG: hypothetical protein OXD29_10975 [Roseovarius sp.]|nr:hypothetical protein [Roseovarius sp.]MCY4208456.1 hypothetical protein [Roseovarius sp.]MCY4315647.1 hypothetical protein [Roseovarius sp.]